MPHAGEIHSVAVSARDLAELAASAPNNRPPDSHLVGGLWTPTDGSGAGLAFAVARGRFRVHEDLVIAWCRVDYPATASGANSRISGLPFIVAGIDEIQQGFISYSTFGAGFYTNPVQNTANADFFTLAGANITNVALSGKQLYATFIYLR